MRSRFRGTLATAAALAVVFSVSACRTTQNPGEQISDQAITAQVKTKLAVERFSNIVNVSVDVTNGVVTLAGEVPNEEVRREAEAEARSVEGVKRVNNNLQVSRPARP